MEILWSVAADKRLNRPEVSGAGITTNNIKINFEYEITRRKSCHYYGR